MPPSGYDIASPPSIRSVVNPDRPFRSYTQLVLFQNRNSGTTLDAFTGVPTQAPWPSHPPGLHIGLVQSRLISVGMPFPKESMWQPVQSTFAICRLAACRCVVLVPWPVGVPIE